MATSAGLMVLPAMRSIVRRRAPDGASAPLGAPHHEGGKALSHPILILRHRRSARAERALHHHGVEPAAEFEADIRMRPDHLEAARGVHADRSGVGGIADHGDHLAVAAALAFLD